MQFQGRLHLVKASLRWCLDVDLYIRLYSVYQKMFCTFQGNSSLDSTKEPIYSFQPINQQFHLRVEDGVAHLKNSQLSLGQPCLSLDQLQHLALVVLLAETWKLRHRQGLCSWGCSVHLDSPSLDNSSLQGSLCRCSLFRTTEADKSEPLRSLLIGHHLRICDSAIGAEEGRQVSLAEDEGQVRDVEAAGQTIINNLRASPQLL